MSRAVQWISRSTAAADGRVWSLDPIVQRLSEHQSAIFGPFLTKLPRFCETESTFGRVALVGEIHPGPTLDYVCGPQSCLDDRSGRL